MIIKDTWHDPPVFGLPSVIDVVQGLTDPEPDVACKAIRDMRHLLDMIERAQLPLLMARPGMNPNKAAGILGRSADYVNARTGHPRRRE